MIYLIWKWFGHVVVSTLIAEDMTGEVGHADLLITRPVGTPATNQRSVFKMLTNQKPHLTSLYLQLSSWMEMVLMSHLRQGC